MLTNFPQKLLPPLVVTGIFLLGLALTYAVPWMGTGKDGEDSRWTWGHEMREFLDMNGMTTVSDPVSFALAASIVGLTLGLLWTVLVFVLPSRLLTPRREAAFLTLFAVPVYLLLLAGGRGLGLGLQWGSGKEGVWGVSVAGIVTLLAATGLLMVGAWHLLRCLPSQRIAVALLAGTLAGAALFHAVPWLTTNAETAPTTPTGSLWADAFGMTFKTAFDPTGSEPLVALAAAHLVAFILCTLWVVTRALAPDHPRATPLVESAFALLLGIPLMLAVVGVGKPLGLGLSRLFSTAPGWGLSIAGFVFLVLLAAFGTGIWLTLRRALASLEVGA